MGLMWHLVVVLGMVRCDGVVCLVLSLSCLAFSFLVVVLPYLALSYLVVTCG
jgi:hypothetical protein